MDTDHLISRCSEPGTLFGLVGFMHVVEFKVLGSFHYSR